MDFQPIFMAGYTLRKKDKSFWETKVRPIIVSLTNPTCSICGFVAAEKRSLIHADEVWSFPAPPRVVLVEVRAICVYCHDAKDYEYLLLRIPNGKPGGAQQAAIVQNHYCKVNACSAEEFNADYKAASEEKRGLEKLYGNHCAVEVDYGKWTPPQRSQRLTLKQKVAVKALFMGETPIEYDEAGEPIGGGEWVRDEPIIVHNIELKTFGTAIKYLQSLPLEERELSIKEMQKYVELEYDSDDDDWIYEHNEGLKPWLRGMYPFSN